MEFSPNTFTTGNVVAEVILNRSGNMSSAGWTKINETTREKIYTENVSGEVVEFEHSNGLSGNVEVNIDWIKKSSYFIDKGME